MAVPVNQAKQALIDALPETGEVNYVDLYNNLMTSGNRSAVRQFHEMRRNGEIDVRTVKKEDPDAKGRNMFVARKGEGLKGDVTNG